MSCHYFLDESKSNGFVFAVAIVEQADLAQVRAAVRLLAVSGSRRFHASQENKRRVRAAIVSVSAMPVRHLLVTASRHTPLHEARQQALVFIAGQSVGNATRIVIEREDTNVKRDVQTIRRVFRQTGNHQSEVPLYVHLRAHEEPLLWIPDLIAWAYQRGGDWRAHIRALNLQVENL